MIIARQCMFIIIVIGSYFILKWCKIIFPVSLCVQIHNSLDGMLDETLRCDLSLLKCQQSNFTALATMSFLVGFNVEDAAYGRREERKAPEKEVFLILMSKDNSLEQRKFP